MCGISGMFLSKTSLLTPESTESILSSMLNQIDHRGPDGSGIKSFDCGAIGHVRLAVRELSELGAQPMACEELDCWLSYNGELYNTDFLLNHLKKKFDFKPKGNSDTEVLLYLLKFEGIDRTLAMIEGMFAFAYYNQASNSLWLVRDPFGIKPLYFLESDGALVFCSEFNGLIASGQSSRKYNPVAIASLLERNYIIAPYTLYSDVNKLEAGCYIEFNISTIGKDVGKKTQYYKWNDKFKTHFESFDDALNQVDQKLKKAVKSHLVSDVDIGCFLSGGIDSALIASYYQKLSKKRIKTFNISFDIKEFDESIVAQEIAERLGCDHTVFKITSEDVLSLVPDILKQLDEPFADSSIIPTSIVSKMAAKYVKVCVSGDGGDEGFLGYDKYRSYPKVLNKIDLFASLIRVLPSKLITNKFIAGLLPFNNARDKVSKLLEIIKATTASRRALLLDSFWHQAPLLNKTVIDYPRMDFTEVNYTNILNHFDINYYLPDDLLVKSDIASMSHSLELRVPFLDKNLFEFARSIPHEFKVNKNDGKVILRELLGRFVPKEITELPKKGFRVPLDEWLRGSLHDYAEEKINIALNKINFIDKKAVLNLWNIHQTERGNYGYWLWSLVVLGGWLELNEE